MEMEKKFKTKKLISMLCLVFSMVLFASNWIVAIDDDAQEKISIAIEKLDEVANIDDDDVEDFENLLEEYNSDFSMKQYKKSVINLLNTFEDMKISPLEMPSLILPSLNIVNMSDGKYIDEFFGIDSEAIGIILVFSIVNTIAIILTLLIAILYVVLHIKNGDGVGTPILVLHLLTLGIMKFSCYLINVNISTDMTYEKVANLSMAPLISLIVLIVSFIVWKSAMKSKSLLDKSKRDVGTNIV